MADTTTEQQTNRLRAAMVAAAHQVDSAYGEVNPYGGNPLQAQLSTLQDAWVTSPQSTTRTRSEDDLREAGSRIAAGFRAVEDECQAEARNQPLEVPEDDWRASFPAHGMGPV